MYQYYELTQPQRRIWTTQTLYPESAMYNIGGTATIYGDINIDKLKRALHETIMNHDSFRIRIHTINAQPYQYFSTEEVPQIDIVSFVKCDVPQLELERWVEKNAKKVLTLEDSPLYQVAIYLIEENVVGYFMKLHHIIADGWSFQIIVNEVKMRYECLISNKKYNQDLFTSYSSYIALEKKYLSSPRYYKDKEFWNKIFKVLPDSLVQLRKSTQGKRKSFLLSEQKSNILKMLSEKYNTSLNTILVAIYLLYIYKKDGNKTVIIGIPVLGRSGKTERKTIGMFVSSMPIFYEFDKNKRISEFIKDIDIVLKNSYKHQKYPYNHLVNDLKLGDVSLYSNCVNYYHTTMCNEIDGHQVVNKEFYNGEQAYDLQLIIREWYNNEIQIDIDYNIEFYDCWQISDLFLRLEILIDKISNNPNQCIRTLNLLDVKEEDELIKKFNMTSFPLNSFKSVVELFRDTVRENPNRVAIKEGKTDITYEELAKKATCLAKLLIKNGVRRNDVIGLYTNNSIELFIGIWGILMAGAAYLPISYECPHERMKYMLEDASVSILLTNLDTTKLLQLGCIVFDIRNVINNNMMLLDDFSELVKTTGDDLAYVIYTSGSTGKPKGVLIPHYALANYVTWAIRQYAINQYDTMPLFSSLAFDLTVTTLFGPLIVGGNILVYQKNGTLSALRSILNDNLCTILKVTPSHLELIKDRDNSKSIINRIIVGGEILKNDLAAKINRSFCGRVDIYNEYGPTEATVGCMVYQYNIKDTTKAVPIGKPADNVRLYVLDQDRNPVPVGYMGELFIAGDCLAKGYLKDANYTKEKFVSGSHLGEDRMYKTDDIVRFITSDCLMYMHRNDTQVKIHGYRIELEEIETCLRALNAIQQVVVLKITQRNAEYLCAYYVASKKIEVSEIKEHLKKQLPDYMIPAMFIQLDSIPLTSNGKINTNKMKQMIEKSCEKDPEYLPNQKGKKEQLLLESANTVLDSEISLNDNFYQIGGDSIKAIQLSAKIQEHGYILSVKNIIAHPILRDMINYIKKEDKREISQKLCEGMIFPLPIIEQFFLKGYPNRNAYCQCMILKMKGQYDAATYEMMLKKLIEHHDSLRIRVDKNDVLYYTEEIQNICIKVETISNVNMSDAEREKYIVSRICDDTKSINIADGNIIQSIVYRFEDNLDYWGIRIHHIAIDAISWRILLDGIQGMLNQISKGDPLKLPLKTDSYQHWTEYVNSIAYKYENERDYWRKQFEYPLFFEGLSEIRWPTNAVCLPVTIPNYLTKVRLLQACDVYGISIEEFLLASIALAFYSYFGKNRIIIALERHGRENIDTDIDLSRTIGWFTSVFPIQLPICYENIDTHIKSIKECLRHVPNKGLGFGLCIEPGQIIKSEHNWIGFNYLGEIQGAYPSFSVDLHKSLLDNSENLSNIIEIIGYIKEEKLCLVCRIPNDNMYLNKLSNFIDDIKKSIEDVVEYCLTRTGKCYTPSDFSASDLTQEELDIILSED